MHRIKKLVPQSIRNLYHFVQAVLANLIYGFPAKNIRIIGVTGTDGKTTTTQMVTRILEEAGKKVAMTSTINFRIAGKEKKNLSHYTTLSAFAVQKFLKQAVDEDCEYVVLETSSHSLDQFRVWGIEYEIAIVTNITREHLDYHKTMDEYRRAKKRLFEITAKNKGVIIVNLDMENPDDFLDFNVENKYGYTTHGSQRAAYSSQLNVIEAESVELNVQNTKYKVRDVEFTLHIPGEFNVENALAAICVGLAEGISLDKCAVALAKIEGVPGRMESIPNDKGLDVIVDFALTPQALDRLYGFLSGVKKNSQSKILAVFGSCGERDRGKRPLMGEIVAKYADYVILTNDEPYHEDPEEIIREIAKGIKNKKEGENFWKIIDRREAIAKALSLGRAGDIVVVTGMGNFESMIIGDEKIPWNDKSVIREELEKI